VEGSGENASVVLHSLDGAIDYLDQVLKRRPNLLQERFNELLEEDAEGEAEAEAGMQSMESEAEGEDRRLQQDLNNNNNKTAVEQHANAVAGVL
jgi:hypothetical protein